MRPDIEDYEELENAEAESKRGRAMSWLVLSVSIVIFGSLAYYAYHSGTEMQNGDVMVVEAENTPIKEVPADAEGEQFANQDKTIYDVISPNASENASVEKLLPEAEKPVSSPQDVAANSEPTTYVNKNLKANEEVPSAKEKPAPMVVPVPSNVVSKSVTQPVDAKPAAGTAIKPVVAEQVSMHDEDGGPTFVNESPVAEVKSTVTKTTSKKEAVKAEVKKEVAKPVVKKETAKPAEKKAVASSGSYQVQLGAFKSEDEAHAQWKKLTGKYSNVLTGSPVVVKADLPNGTFYRLRTGGFASADAAKAACGKLGGAACFPVK